MGFVDSLGRLDGEQKELVIQLEDETEGAYLLLGYSAGRKFVGFRIVVTSNGAIFE